MGKGVENESKSLMCHVGSFPTPKAGRELLYCAVGKIRKYGGIVGDEGIAARFAL